MIKDCAICKKPFNALGKSKTCSEECAKELDRKQKRDYSQTAKSKAVRKAYRETPESKAYQKTYRQNHEDKAYQKAYRETPEYKIANKAYQKAYREKRKAQK